jgi:hypothetical protein
MNRKSSESFDPGIGPTDELSLRVSVAALTRVLFEPHSDGEVMLALERKATLHESENGSEVRVKSQPFGGAIRINDLNQLRDLVGEFHFDSQKSQFEQDFRIFVRPSDWPAVREFCMEQFHRADGLYLETDPTRELVEEFVDALKMELKPDQYTYRPVATVVEENPTPTANVHSKGHRTARVYRIFEARIVDHSLAHTMLTNSESHSDQRLSEIALEDAQRGGKGRSNATLALPLKDVIDAYQAISPDERNTPIVLAGHRLDETVAALFEDIPVLKYKRL